jgi:hypothetical protein
MGYREKTSQAHNQILEKVLRHFEVDSILPDAVAASPHDVTDLILLAWNPSRRVCSLSTLAERVFEEKGTRARNLFNATFRNERQDASTGGTYRQLPTVEVLRSFLSVVFKLWTDEYSPQHYRPPIDLAKVINNICIAYTMRRWDNIAPLLRLLAEVPEVTMHELRGLASLRLHHLGEDRLTLEIVSKHLERIRTFKDSGPQSG